MILILIIDAMPLRKEWSYLVGYFLGDGSSFMAGRDRAYRQYKVCCHEDDKFRVDRVLRSLGVDPNWRKTASPTTMESTIPYKKAEELWLDKLPMGNSNVRIPSWPELDLISVVEGLFDAEGHLGYHKRMRASGHEYRQGVISLQVANEGLRDDVYGILQNQGFTSLTRGVYKREPHSDIFRVNVNKPDYRLFKEKFHLQEKKQLVLEMLQ